MLQVQLFFYRTEHAFRSTFGWELLLNSIWTFHQFRYLLGLMVPMNSIHIQYFIGKPLVEKMILKRLSKVFDLFSVKKQNFKRCVLAEEAQNGLHLCAKSPNVDGSIFLLCFVLYSFSSSPSFNSDQLNFIKVLEKQLCLTLEFFMFHFMKVKWPHSRCYCQQSVIVISLNLDKRTEKLNVLRSYLPNWIRCFQVPHDNRTNKQQFGNFMRR